MKRRLNQIALGVSMLAGLITVLLAVGSYFRMIEAGYHYEVGWPSTLSGWASVNYHNIGVTRGWLWWQADHNLIYGTLRAQHKGYTGGNSPHEDMRWYLLEPTNDFAADPELKRWLVMDYAFERGPEQVVESNPRLVLRHDTIRVRVSLWALALPIAVLATWLFRRRQLFMQREHRTAKRLCVKCGYDLRATPERCPECGMVPMTGSVTAK